MVRSIERKNLEMECGWFVVTIQNVTDSSHIQELENSFPKRKNSQVVSHLLIKMELLGHVNAHLFVPIP